MATQSPFDAKSDVELLEASRAGDRGALEALLLRHQARVYRFGMQMCRDPEDARDILQETLLAMARGVREFRGASSISTWLYSVARSFCIKKHRKSKFAPEASQFESVDAADLTDVADRTQLAPDDALAGKEVEQALESAIRALDPTYREVLLLRDVEGLTAPEVAEVLGVSVQAVKTRLHRARVAVRARVAPALGSPVDAPNPVSTCPDVLTLFSQHLEDEIRPEVCIEMERHLDQCERCRNACDSLKQTLALCHASGPATVVPSHVQDAVHRALRDFLKEHP